MSIITVIFLNAETASKIWQIKVIPILTTHRHIKGWPLKVDKPVV